MGVYADEAKRLLAAGFLPVPSFQKRPAVAHKPERGGQPRWRRDMVLANLDKFDHHKDLGILCDNGVFVVDFDDEAVYEAWRRDGFAADFDATVLARTRKGYHAWFRRTPLCDELSLTDGPVGSVVLPDGSKAKKPMDIKTLTASSTLVQAEDGSTSTYYTPGFCAVYPSPNKSWVRSPFEYVLQPLPDALARRLHAERHENAGPRTGPVRPASTPPLPAPAAFSTPAGDESFWGPCRLDLVDLGAMGFPLDKLIEVATFYSLNARTREAGYVGNRTLQFKVLKGVACPLCRKQEGHDNSYNLLSRADGTRVVKSTSPACFPRLYQARDGTMHLSREPGRYARTPVTIPWTEAGLAGWLAAMRDASEPVRDEALQRFTSVYNYFTNPRDAFLWQRKRLVLLCDQGVAAVDFSLPASRGGAAVATLTRMPWLEELPGAWSVPVGLKFCEETLI